MRVHRYKENRDLSFAASLSLQATLVGLRKGSVILASGASTKLLYEDVANSEKKFAKDLQFYHLDEFLNIESKYTFSEELQQTVVRPWGLTNHHFWPSNAREAMDMAEQVDNLFEQNPPELCILGIGSNGHIGFNEPGSALYSRSRIVSLAEPSRKNLAQRFGRIEDVPTQAIAMGIATILRAKKIILLASGEKKAEAIGKMIHGPVSILCPASFLRLHDNVEVFLDEEASKDLDNRRDYFQEEKTLLRTGEKIEGNILFCSPHPDDTSIAAGGFLFRHSASNKVKTINFYSGHRSDIPGTTLEERIKVRNSEAKEEARHLNISMHFSEFTGYDDSYRINDKDLTRLADLISTEKPRHIFLPKLDDDHPAHRACTKLLLRCLEKFPQLHQINLWFYETPWSLFKPGEANVFVALGQDEVAAKLKAIGAHRSQVARIPYDYGAEALARLRAVLAREQDLSSFGKTGPDLGKHVECFWRIQAG